MSAQRGARKRTATPYQPKPQEAGDDDAAPAAAQQNQGMMDGNPPSNRSSQQQQWSPGSDQPQDGQDLDEYTLKRLRNNAAVSRTRQKKRAEQQHTSQRVKELREENAQLERTLDTMKRELALLKEMVVVCAAKGDDGGGADATAGGKAS